MSGPVCARCDHDASDHHHKGLIRPDDGIGYLGACSRSCGCAGYESRSSPLDSLQPILTQPEQAWRAEEFGFHATPDERMDEHEAYVTGYRAGVAASGEMLDEIIWSEIPADGQAHDISESHCLICGSYYPRHLSDCRFAALRTTKEGEDG